MKKFFLSTILASALILPASAFATPSTGTPTTQTAPAHDKTKHDGPKHHKNGEKGPHESSLIERHQAMMKEQFIKMEEELNLRPDQKPIWSKYVESVMEIMSPMERPAPGPKHESLLPGERMADHYLEKRPKAERLKTVIAELRKTLDDNQLKRLTEMNAEHMNKKPGPHHHKTAPTPEKPKP